MSLYQILCEKYTENSTTKVKSLGYNNEKKATIKWKNLIEARSIEKFLEEEKYDLVHTNSSFILKVCDVLMINPQEAIDAMKSIRILHYQEAQMSTPYIFVNTNFVRQNEPIFVLACLEHLRRISVTKRVVICTDDEGLSDALSIIKDHYRVHEGKLVIWGVIANYHYVVNGKRYIIDQKGTVLECADDNASHESKATLH